MISGKGNPNHEDFSNRVGALYSLAYSIKMRYKAEHKEMCQEDTDMEEFSVYPLEGVWDMEEEAADTLLLETYEKYEYLAREKGLPLHIRLPEEECPPVLCDEERIAQVLSILMDNALSYTPAPAASIVFPIRSILSLQQHSRCFSFLPVHFILTLIENNVNYA